MDDWNFSVSFVAIPYIRLQTDLGIITPMRPPAGYQCSYWDNYRNQQP